MFERRDSERPAVNRLICGASCKSNGNSFSPPKTKKKKMMKITKRSLVRFVVYTIYGETFVCYSERDSGRPAMNKHTRGASCKSNGSSFNPPKRKEKVRVRVNPPVERAAVTTAARSTRLNEKKRLWLGLPPRSGG